MTSLLKVPVERLHLDLGRLQRRVREAGLGDLLELVVERDAVDDVGLVVEHHVVAERHVAEEADAQLVPGRGDWQHGHPAVHQRAARKVPEVVVVIAD